jgi:hypothetical protein
MPEMKYYITYGNWTQEVMANNPQEAVPKAMEKWAKTVEKAGCKLVFWGSALGVPENAICVIKGTPENWLKLPFGADAPYTDTRTHVVLKW